MGMIGAMGWKGVGLPPRSHFDSAQHERPRTGEGSVAGASMVKGLEGCECVEVPPSSQGRLCLRRNDGCKWVSGVGGGWGERRLRFLAGPRNDS